MMFPTAVMILDVSHICLHFPPTGPGPDEKETLLTIAHSNRDTHEAFLRSASSIGRVKTEHKDPGDIVEAHYIHSSQRGVALLINVERVYHDGTSETDERRDNPEETPQILNKVRDGSQRGARHHGYRRLGCGHEDRLGLAEAVACDDERVEVGDACIRNCVADPAGPDAPALWIS